MARVSKFAEMLVRGLKPCFVGVFFGSKMPKIKVFPVYSYPRHPSASRPVSALRACATTARVIRAILLMSAITQIIQAVVAFIQVLMVDFTNWRCAVGVYPSKNMSEITTTSDRYALVPMDIKALFNFISHLSAFLKSSRRVPSEDACFGIISDRFAQLFLRYGVWHTNNLVDVCEFNRRGGLIQ